MEQDQDRQDRWDMLIRLMLDVQRTIRPAVTWQMKHFESQKGVPISAISMRWWRAGVADSLILRLLFAKRFGAHLVLHEGWDDHSTNDGNLGIGTELAYWELPAYGTRFVRNDPDAQFAFGDPYFGNAVPEAEADVIKDITNTVQAYLRITSLAA